MNEWSIQEMTNRVVLKARKHDIVGDYRFVSNFSAEPDWKELKKILRVTSESVLSMTAQNLLQKVKTTAQNLVCPATLYIVQHNSPQIQHFFRDAEYIVFSAVTIGSALEEEVNRLNTVDQLTEALLLDVVGSAWVEGSVNQVDDLISKEATAMGCFRARRKSPGYHPWPLEYQKDFFTLLPMPQINVKLNESYMMIPRKSVTFAVPLLRCKRKLFSIS